jgi:hypothetical protein
VSAPRHPRGLARFALPEFASHIGWYRSKIAKIESGERRIDVAEFITIADTLKIEPGYQEVALTKGVHTMGGIDSFLKTSLDAWDDVSIRSADG